jgi:hypothetical protein
MKVIESKKQNLGLTGSKYETIFKIKLLINAKAI